MSKWLTSLNLPLLLFLILCGGEAPFYIKIVLHHLWMTPNCQNYLNNKINYLVTNCTSKIIGDMYRSIKEFKKGYQLGTNFAEMGGTCGMYTGEEKSFKVFKGKP
jgi:hypothetical protein